MCKNFEKLQSRSRLVLPNYLSVVKPVRLIAGRGLSSDQVTQVEQILSTMCDLVIETWLLVDNFSSADICLANHQSFFKSKEIIPEQFIVVLCTETEISSLDYEFQIQDPIQPYSLIKTLNHFSKKLKQYALNSNNKPSIQVASEDLAKEYITIV